jgi:hypothetical protein
MCSLCFSGDARPLFTVDQLSLSAAQGSEDSEKYTHSLGGTLKAETITNACRCVGGCIMILRDASDE